MYLTGKFDINPSAKAIEELGCDTIVVPFKNFPIMPVGTTVFINSNDGTFYLEALELLNYRIDNRNGVEIFLGSGGCLDRLFMEAAKCCDRNEPGQLTYREVVDFQNCN